MASPSQPKTAVILPAGGKSTRFGSETKKQFYRLGDKPLLAHTLERVLSAGQLHVVVVAVPKGDLERVRQLVAPLMPLGTELQVVTGGATRQASVAHGLNAVPANVDLVVVHDAVRPLFEPAWIRQTIALCREYDGAIVALPTTDTLKEVATNASTQAPAAGAILRTIPRKTIWRAQTPQTFRARILRDAFIHAQLSGQVGTDEATLVEAVGGQVAVVEGSSSNIKVTTPEDWAYLEWRLSHPGGTPPDD